jgi:hypothetical protein
MGLSTGPSATESQGTNRGLPAPSLRAGDKALGDVTRVGDGERPFTWIDDSPRISWLMKLLQAELPVRGEVEVVGLAGDNR